MVVGFGSLSPYRARPAYRTTVEDSVYVDPAHQGRGVGRGVLEMLVDAATQHGFHTVVGRIAAGTRRRSPSTTAAASRPSASSARWAGSSRDWLDVVVMQRVLG